MQVAGEPTDKHLSPIHTQTGDSQATVAYILALNHLVLENESLFKMWCLETLTHSHIYIHTYIRHSRRLSCTCKASKDVLMSILRKKNEASNRSLVEWQARCLLICSIKMRNKSYLYLVNIATKNQKRQEEGSGEICYANKI